MLAFLLGLIPAPWLAVLKGLPWRLIGYAVAAIAVVWLVLMVNGWRVDSHRLQATQKALAASEAKVADYARDAVAQQEAFTAAVAAAKSTEAADKAAAERVQHDLETRLAAADAGSRDLARRLRDYQARRCGGTVPGPAAAAGQPDARGGEPGGATEVDRRTDEYHAACDRDAVAVDGWWQWWQEVSGNR